MPKFDTGRVKELSSQYIDCICSNCGSVMMTARAYKNGETSGNMFGMKCSNCGSDKFIQRENKIAEEEAELLEFYQIVRRALLMIVSWIDKRE